LQLGPSFNGQQPVIFNPQAAPLQTPQAYFHPGGPQVQYLPPCISGDSGILQRMSSQCKIVHVYI